MPQSPQQLVSVLVAVLLALGQHVLDVGTASPGTGCRRSEGRAAPFLHVLGAAVVAGERCDDVAVEPVEQIVRGRRSRSGCSGPGWRGRRTRRSGRRSGVSIVSAVSRVICIRPRAPAEEVVVGEPGLLRRSPQRSDAGSILSRSACWRMMSSCRRGRVTAGIVLADVDLRRSRSAPRRSRPRPSGSRRLARAIIRPSARRRADSITRSSSRSSSSSPASLVTA